jgi:hypothetical protein
MKSRECTRPSPEVKPNDDRQGVPQKPPFPAAAKAINPRQDGELSSRLAELDRLRRRLQTLDAAAQHPKAPAHK